MEPVQHTTNNASPGSPSWSRETPKSSWANMTQAGKCLCELWISEQGLVRLSRSSVACIWHSAPARQPRAMLGCKLW